MEEVELEVVVAACTPEEQQIVAEELDSDSLETPVEDSLERSYQILGVSALSTAAEIKLKHRQLVRAYHPDRLQGMAEDLSELANKRLAEINGAYRLLRKNAKT